MTRTPEPEALRAGPLGPDAVQLALSLNGTEHTLTLEPRVTLLDALRERLGLTGTKTRFPRHETS